MVLMPAHFNEAGLKFLRNLKRNNDREWFNPRKETYETEVKAPMLAVIAEVNHALAGFAPEYLRDPAKIMMRIYRDIRFSPNKQPYKTNAAAWWARQGMEKTTGAGFYLDVSPEQVTIAAGCYMPAKEQLLAIRRYLLDHHEEMRKLLAGKKLTSAGMLPFEGATLTRPPKGFPADSPAIDLILHRQWGVAARLPAQEALQPGFVAEIVKRYKLALPLVTLLNEPIQPVPKPIF
jgi:uncharacterized protein (TIGR02453 family)